MLQLQRQDRLCRKFKVNLNREKPHCHSFISFFFLNFDISVRCSASMRYSGAAVGHFVTEWVTKMPGASVQSVCVCVCLRALKDNSRNTFVSSVLICVEWFTRRQMDGWLQGGRQRTEEEGECAITWCASGKHPLITQKPTPVTNVLF